jgi:hypothetical protein
MLTLLLIGISSAVIAYLVAFKGIRSEGRTSEFVGSLILFALVFVFTFMVGFAAFYLYSLPE